MPIQVNKRLISVSDYHKMGEVGILSESGLELINGEIIYMNPIGSQHAAMVEKLKDVLVFQLHGKALVRSQNPIILSDFTEPEPDICVVKFRDDYYSEKHPESSEVLLIIEVADTSLEYDREVKLPLYAEAKIPELWIINLQEKYLEQFSSPENGKYHSHTIFKSGQANSLSSEVRIELDSLFS